ncbi:MAG: NADPH-dependent F420 reductase [Thaumarchaeota archaeon]|nr:NADPH-dependent F420 reductase [Nitrososphaerota archaeon]
MKVAILGGTGKFGKGLALRLAKSNDIIIGSRDRSKAKATADLYTNICKKHNSNFSNSIEGEDNVSAAQSANIVFFCLKLGPALELASSLNLKKQIVVSPIVNINSQESLHPRLSCAEALAAKLGFRDRVVSALHPIPYKRLADIEKPVNCDVLVCGDDVRNAMKVCKMIEEIGDVRAFYAGPLKLSIYVEGIAVALVSLAKQGNIENPTIRIV